MHNQFKTQKFKYLMLAMGPRDLNSAPYSPVHCSNHSMTSFQSSELTELPVVENSQLFAQRTVRPLCLCHMDIVQTPPPPPRVQRTILSSKNTIRTGVFIGHAVLRARQYSETAVTHPSAQDTQPIQSTK